MDKQTGKLIARIAENLPDMDGDLMQNWIDNPKGLQNVLGLALCPPGTAPLDPLIRVDRTIRPNYPEWVTKMMHPDLEVTGSAEFNVSRIEQWLHPSQKAGVKGEVIYEYLKKNGMLENCLDFRDLEEIQKKGLAFFKEHFQDKAVFGWRSVVRDRRGRLGVPYLVEFGGMVVLCWGWLSSVWLADSPALRFAS